jgi:hypothetical protein
MSHKILQLRDHYKLQSTGQMYFFKRFLMAYEIIPNIPDHISNNAVNFQYYIFISETTKF